MNTLITCKHGCEQILAKEAALYQGTLKDKGRGWILVEWSATPPSDLCFAYHMLTNPIKVEAGSVNALTEQLLNHFTTHLKDKRISEPWPLLFTGADEEQLSHRANTVLKNWLEHLKKKMSRVSKLAQTDFPYGAQWIQGFFVYFTTFDQAYASFEGLGAQQKRMRMDIQAPSRSYLKIEEAFHLFGTKPQDKDIVIDLGAAPGGWSHSALKCGAAVTAIDNGPMKGSVASHPQLSHLQEDAFKYQYKGSQPANWLLCDILEQPDIVLTLLDNWLREKWCRRFIVNLKVSRNDPLLLLQKIRDPNKGVASYCTKLIVKQLYHDREEMTLMGLTRTPGVGV